MELAVLNPVDVKIPESLLWAHPVVQEWFVRRFGTPTEPQEQGWPAILAGQPTLISAPTGSGKTLAAFLICIDRLIRKSIAGTLEAQTEVVYVSPLKALSNDIQKNLDGPLREIQQLALDRGYLGVGVRTGVRTGDTLPKERQAMLRKPPHILVTTPESLYILLTAEKSRNNLRHVRTVIVDEIHAVADDKRGSHLALSLERLDALVCGENRLSPGAMICGLQTPPLRIGLSATQNPIELVAEFLTGHAEGRAAARIVQTGRRRVMDLAIELPDDELGSVTTHAMWNTIYDRIAALALEHRSTLIFVNTRRLVERLAFALAERLGAENVAAHHGSLSRTLRFEAEQKLKQGEIRALVCTASLELGIDIGAVELVCQISSPRAIGVAMQRAGRAGHWRGAIPKARFFPTTRDDLIECAALVRAMRSGELDRLEMPPQPLDVLMQQIVAACAAEQWEEQALFEVMRRATPYRELTRAVFDELLTLLSEGIEVSRGRYGAYLLRDRVHGHLQARRGARTIAVSNGGTIPDTALFQVIVMPEGTQIATLDEDFAIDSSAGDVILLGNTSWRIQRVESAGRVLVEDAQGQPPNVPFWRGEAPQRTVELCEFVSKLRVEVAARCEGLLPGYISEAQPVAAEASAWLQEQCAVCASGALQIIGYIVAGKAVLGAVPALDTIIAERFFDEGGGMQLILHAPFGGRINKAWGLALRKRFCRGFNFELQAAATDNGLSISLSEQHSFPLSDVFQFLTEQTVQELLEQASLTSPIFKSRWRWSAGRSLQLLRFQKGKKVAPQVQRTRSDDLLASVFPQVAACQENIEGDIEIPKHPLVREVMQDVLQEAMDLVGLKQVIAGIQSGAIRCLAVDTPVPSQFAHELLNANPYAFLDDAPLEERRARAVSMRRTLPDSVLDGAGRLDQAAIAEVRAECWPDIRDEHELHDLLCALVILPAGVLDHAECPHWGYFLEKLEAHGRAARIEIQGRGVWVAAERAAYLRAMLPETAFPQGFGIASEETPLAEDARLKMVQGWLQVLGPVTSLSLGGLLGMPASGIYQALLRMEMSGIVLRGHFETVAVTTIENSSEHEHSEHAIEWCERRILQRIHRRTLGALRKQIEPVTPAVYMRWLLRWQHVAPRTQLDGEAGLVEALLSLAGFEAPAIEWERVLLPQRVAGYDPRWLDDLCLSGVVGWSRISPHGALTGADAGAPRRVVPTGMAPVTLFVREEAAWLGLCGDREPGQAASALLPLLSTDGQRMHATLESEGACFLADLVRASGLARADAERALWELVAAGLATADAFDGLRALIDPRRKAMLTAPAGMRAGKKPASGRWSLLKAPALAAGERDAAVESACWMLLRRYGVLFRDLLTREVAAPRWRELLPMLRRLEARGTVRGGRFVTGFGGEQFAVPEAVDSLRAMHRQSESLGPGAEPERVRVSAADPLNLAGIVVPGERVAAVPGRCVQYQDGVVWMETGAGFGSSAEETKALPGLAEPLKHGKTGNSRHGGLASGDPALKNSMEGSSLFG